MPNPDFMRALARERYSRFEPPPDDVGIVPYVVIAAGDLKKVSGKGKGVDFIGSRQVIGEFKLSCMLDNYLPYCDN